MSGGNGHGDDDNIENLVEYGLAGIPTDGNGYDGVDQLASIHTQPNGDLVYVFEIPENAPTDLRYDIQVTSVGQIRGQRGRPSVGASVGDRQALKSCFIDRLEVES
jgi:hypothetical protein